MRKLLFSLILFFSITILANVESFAGTQEWKDLNYDVTVNSDGSMDVVETWNIYIEETNTLFKDFNLDKSKFSNVSNVNVSRVENGRETYLEEIYEEQYHVDKGCFYGLQTDSNTFQIAWNVGLDDSTDTRVYKIYYHIEDAVKVYNDCTELYWMFLGKENDIPADHVSGSVKLPMPVDNFENLRVWAHGDLDGEIQKQSNDIITFNIPKLYTGTMLEIRIVTEENIYTDCTNSLNKDMLGTILEEEAEWANKANFERSVARTLLFACYVIYLVLFVIIILNIIKYFKTKKEYSYQGTQIDYFRDIPDETATPASAAYMYYYNKNRSYLTDKMPKIFAATMLDLALKKYIEFEPTNNGKDMLIRFINKSNEDALSKDEKDVYKLLKGASGNKNEFSMKELKKYAEKEYSEFNKKANSIEKFAEDYQEKKGYFDAERKKIASNISKKNIASIVVASLLFLGLMIGINTKIGNQMAGYIVLMIVELIVNIFVISKTASIVSILSEQGNQKEKEWKALKHYMEDFSLLKDREVPELVLWEKYLVYATAFGISKKVIKQLKVVYPELMNEDYYTSQYTYLHMMSHDDNGFDFVSHIDSGFQSVWAAANSASSSASGGGGGFSSGGGGGRRWRRLWRSLNR